MTPQTWHLTIRRPAPWLNANQRLHGCEQHDELCPPYREVNR